MIVEIKLSGTPVMIRVTEYWPAIPASEFEPPEQEYIEFEGATNEVEAILDSFGLHPKIYDAVLAAYKKAHEP